ncbi:Receptor-like protein kinase FERONIA [Vitis vinifera]|uniref:Receptor-like protein kinase FERONIA n=1 Tax=Vitis vinifera TaxID=29760 RepID=A0A438HE76_VITVI|nr:Receptor-like protein kinase FERONIA [Vitis vinifera]
MLQKSDSLYLPTVIVSLLHGQMNPKQDTSFASQFSPFTASPSFIIGHLSLPVTPPHFILPRMRYFLILAHPATPQPTMGERGLGIMARNLLRSHNLKKLRWPARVPQLESPTPQLDYLVPVSPTLSLSQMAPNSPIHPPCQLQRLSYSRGANASREFCINVEKEDQVPLHVTFTPSSSTDSYAFVNGIEIFSMPLNLYYGAEDREVPYVGQTTNYQIESGTALETVYRLNVGGPSIEATDDSGLFRVWSIDDGYVKGDSASNTSPQGVRINYTEDTPAYVAPEEVYLTYRSMGRNRLRNTWNNLTWILPVDLGFMYLVRLHFCETNREIVDVSDRQFTIYIDSQMVDSAFDVIAWSKGDGIPVFKDYAVRIESNGSKGKYNLPIDLGTRPGYSKYVDAFLNGIEIFKLNKTDGTLAGQNPEPPNTQPSLPATKKSTNKKTMFIAIGAAVMVGLVLLSLLLYIIFRPRRKTRYYNSYSRKSWWLWYWCWGQHYKEKDIW